MQLLRNFAGELGSEMVARDDYGITGFCFVCFCNGRF